MSKTIASASAVETDATGLTIATSAVIIGRPRFGDRCLLSEGAVVRSSASLPNDAERLTGWTGKQYVHPVYFGEFQDVGAR